MREPGQQSKHLALLMTAEDATALDVAFDPRAFGAVWTTNDTGAVVEQADLSVALSAGRGQAFLRLARAGETAGPLIQYLAGRQAEGNPDYLRAGGLGYRWLRHEIDPALAQQFEEVASGLFAAARSITSAGVIRHDGTRVRGLRIGQHARRWYLARPWPERQLWDESTVATYRLAEEMSST